MTCGYLEKFFWNVEKFLGKSCKIWGNKWKFGGKMKFGEEISVVATFIIFIGWPMTIKKTTDIVVGCALES